MVRKGKENTSTCLHCGKPFEPKRKGQKFHSDKCRLAYWAQRGRSNIVVELTCPVCNTKFPTSDKRRRYCSPECYAEANLARSKRRYEL